jgi:hypothetical protein
LEQADTSAFMMIKLQDRETITVEDVNEAILRNDPAELEFVSITVALSDLDFHFVQSICIGLASSPHNKVRGSALVSLGHLARRYRLLDEQSVKPCIESALLDSDEYVRASAKSAADEIHQFLHWSIRGHVYG